MDYEADIAIDETALDIEWLDQPRLMLKYCKHAARARRIMDRTKEALEVCKAQVDKHVRTDPEKFGIMKLTEATVQGAILLHEDYIDAMSKYIDTKYEYEVASLALRSFEQRKSALENLVRLHGMSYFAGPTSPRNLNIERTKKEHSAQMTKQANQAVKIGRTT